MKLQNFFGELKRRNVYKVAVSYAVIAWLLLQAGSILLPTFDAPSWVMKVLVVVIAGGFPIALLMAWAFELTPAGLQRTEDLSPNESIPHWSRRKFIAFIACLALVAGGLFAWQRWESYCVSAARLPLKSIAILPFESLSEDKANAYFAEGIHDEILTRLAAVADLRVISRTSTELYKSKPQNLAEVAHQLGVAHILEGSVQKVGDSVRINVQLIKAEENSHLWADTYDRKLTDIFAVETEVAEKIAGSLAAQLTGGERQQMARVPTENPQAYDNYLRGLALIRRQASTDVRKARALFQKAVELDPLYAQAWAQISIAESQIYFGDEHNPACLERARRAAETAVRLQPQLSEARAALGAFYYLCLQDFDRALSELTEAHHLSPNDGDVILYIGLVQRRQGKLEEAIESLKQSAALDPRNSDIWSNLARSYRGRRDFAQARETFDRAFALSPDEMEFIGEKAESYMAQGNLDAADAAFRGRDLKGTTGALGEQINLLLYRRRFEEAVTTFARLSAKQTERSPLLEADDKSWLGSLQILAGHEAAGRQLLTEARVALQALAAAGDTSPRLAVSLTLASADLGDRTEVEKQAAMLLRRKDDLWMFPEWETDVAVAYARLGDAAKATPLLEHALAVSYRRSLTPALLRLDPVWDPIRSDPHFQRLAATRK